MRLQDRVHKTVQEAEGACANRDVTPVWKLSIADSNDLHSSRGEWVILYSDATDYRLQDKFQVTVGSVDTFSNAWLSKRKKKTSSDAKVWSL